MSPNRLLQETFAKQVVVSVRRVNSFNMLLSKWVAKLRRAADGGKLLPENEISVLGREIGVKALRECSLGLSKLGRMCGQFQLSYFLETLLFAGCPV